MRAVMYVGWIVVACRLGGTGSAVFAEERFFDFFTASFLPPSLTVDPGDTVTWRWQRGSHRLASGTGPDDPAAGALFDVPLDADHPSFSLGASEVPSGGLRFFCRDHPTQRGVVDRPPTEVTVRVAVVDNVFDPEEVAIFEGDSVWWEHEENEAFHTVTSGTGRNDPEAGKLFDEESSDAKPNFTYQFVEPGEYPYFCRPHEALGMDGTVFVQETFVRGDANGDGVVELTDAVVALGYLYLGEPRQACDDAMDGNDDGFLDTADAIYVLGFLYRGTEPIPAPYPGPGPDRTVDSLRCLESP